MSKRRKRAHIDPQEAASYGDGLNDGARGGHSIRRLEDCTKKLNTTLGNLTVTSTGNHLNPM